MIEWIAFFLFLAIVFLFFRFIVIPPFKVSVCANLVTGKFTRILKEGYNLLQPLEYVKTTHWTYVDQRYEINDVIMQTLPVLGSQIDIAPIECQTSDNQVVSIDTLVVYRVHDPQKAMYMSEDPLNLLYQQIISGIRKQVVQYQHDALTRNETNICKAILTQIAEEWTPTYGLAIERLEIQGISFDDDTIRRRRQFRDGLGAYERVAVEKNLALKGSGVKMVNMQ